MPYAGWVASGTVVLFVDPESGTVTEAAEVRMMVETTSGSAAAWTNLYLTAPIEHAHPAGTRLLVRST
jgi:hypothetical protein